MYIRLFRDAAPGDGGGGGGTTTPPLSLSDIEKAIQERQNKGQFQTDPDKKTPPKVDPPPITPGDGKDKIPDLTDKDKIPEGKKLGPDGKTLIDDPEYKKPEEKKDDNPNPPNPDEPPADGDTNNDDPLAFWES